MAVSNYKPKDTFGPMVMRALGSATHVDIQTHIEQTDKDLIEQTMVVNIKGFYSDESDIPMSQADYQSIAKRQLEVHRAQQEALEKLLD